MLTVPFENLDIHLGRPIVLDDDVFFDKIVERRRGGFCYELNGLFAALLRELGFDVTMLSAGVAGPAVESSGFSLPTAVESSSFSLPTAVESSRFSLPPGVKFGPDFDHMALRVALEEEWLADVGFGDSFIEPIRLQQSIVTDDPTGAYRVDADGELRFMTRRGDPGEESWTLQYRFTLAPRELAEYRAMCVYQQTSPESHFTRQRICSLATDTGRITLSDLKLITTTDAVREERMLADEAEFKGVLASHFGIVI